MVITKQQNKMMELRESGYDVVWLFQSISCPANIPMTRAGKRGIAPEESPFFPAPWGRGRGRGQLLKKHWGKTGTGNRYDLRDFRGIFPKD